MKNKMIFIIEGSDKFSLKASHVHLAVQNIGIFPIVSFDFSDKESDTILGYRWSN